MPDREKIIEALQYMISENCTETQFDYTDDIEAAIAMLKEQEAVEPKVEKAILDYQSWHYICGDCGGQIDINDNYCRHCGRVIAHLSNKL